MTPARLRELALDYGPLPGDASRALSDAADTIEELLRQRDDLLRDRAACLCCGKKPAGFCSDCR